MNIDWVMWMIISGKPKIVLDKVSSLWYTYPMIKHYLGMTLVVGTVAVSALLTKETKSETIEPEYIVLEVVDEKIANEEDLYCLAVNIYHESRNDNLAGQAAVADVVLNRVQDTRYPNTVCDVVYEARTYTGKNGKEYPIRNRCQFSWYCDGSPDEPRPGKSWDKAQRIAKNLLTHDEFRGITEGSTHYHATYVQPRWATAKGMHMIGRIGEHIFYRWK